MESTYAAILSLIVFVPTLGALLIGLFVPKGLPDLAKFLSLVCTLIVLALTLWMALPASDESGVQSARFDLGVAGMQDVFNYPWIPTFNIYYFMGVDGISFPLVILTALIFVVSMGASWNIQKHVKTYCVLFLILETGVLGVFFALDFFLFYVFWEVMLLPMYFLIGIWGGPRREYAAIKFFLYTLLGGALMLIAVLMLYFNSDLRELAAESDFRGSATARPVVEWASLHVHPDVEAQLGKVSTTERDVNARVAFFRARTESKDDRRIALNFEPSKEKTGEKVTIAVDSSAPRLTRVYIALADHVTANEVVEAANQNAELSNLLIARLPPESKGDGEVVSPRKLELPPYNPRHDIHTFNLLALMAIGQHTEQFSGPLFKTWPSWGTIQIWAFLLLFIGFAIKVPSVPLHTWLPDAHVEAPTPISMILAGILLKLGGYGIIRICYPICPEAGFDLRWFVCIVGVVSMIYGAFAAMAQKDFKRLVAYSSVSHMGYVVLGLGVWSATWDNSYSTAYWSLGVNGALFQMLAHGFSSAGMFFLVGVVYDRVHHRNLDEFGGLFRHMPVYSGMSIVIFFAALGLPGLCGFIGEFFVTLSAWNFSRVLAVLSASVVILTAGYILWTIQRVYFGPEYKGPHGEHLHDMTWGERLIAIPLLVCAIVFGVYPRAIFDYMTPSVNETVQQLTEHQERREQPSSLSKADEKPPLRAPGAGGGD